MEYFTSKEQEFLFSEGYRNRMEKEQDRLRYSLYRHMGGTRQEIQEDDRMFFVEPDGNIYLGAVKPERICPRHKMDEGMCYEVDSMFLREVQEFVQRHPSYVVIFNIKRGYSRHAGVFPARMVADHEELILEDMSQ